MDHVKLHHAPNLVSQSHLTLMYQLDPPQLSNKDVTNNQSLLPVMLLNGLHTPEVSSQTVELPSITVSYLLDTLQHIGSLKTHGEHHGEKMVTSDLHLEIPVVLLTPLQLQKFEKLKIIDLI